MSKTTAPLLSFGASGQIGKTMVASTWKGISYMRKYSVPANPRTAAQVTHRGLFTDVVAAYRNFYTAVTGRAAWLLTAGSSGKPQSGFNVFTSNALPIIKADPDASFADEATEAANVITIVTKNIDDGTQGDETGDFEVWGGTSPTSLLLLEEKALATGDIVATAVSGAAGSTYYMKIRKGVSDRSGIFKITLSGA